MNFALVKEIWSKTLPYIFVKTLWKASLTFLQVVILLLVVWVLMRGDLQGAIMALVAVIGIAVVWGIVKLFHRYVGYMLKLGYVALIVDYMQDNQLPASGQFTHAKDKVMGNFASGSLAFFVDYLVDGVIRQVTGYLLSILGFVRMLPGGNKVLKFLQVFIKTAIGYIDEAVMSYIFLNEEKNQNKWRLAYEGIVLYGQSWQEIAKTAAIVSAVVILFKYGILFLFFLVMLSMAGLGMVGLIVIGVFYLLLTVVGTLVVEPMLTAAMITTYQDAIKDKEPSEELANKFRKISRKMRELFQKVEEGEEGESGEEMDIAVDGAEDTVSTTPH